MANLTDVVADVRRKIGRYSGQRAINEQNTKTALIDPVVRALGWSVGDLEEVQQEYRRKRSDKPVDYAFLILREPVLFLEAKALGQNLDDRKWANQIMGYATVAGVQWVILTDGDEYRLYNSHAAVPVEKKLFRTIRLTADESPVVETLSLLSKDRMRERDIDRLWQAFFVDRQVESALQAMFTDEPDGALVRAIRKGTDLKPAQIKQSLGRAEVRIEFPVRPEATGPAPKPRRRSKKKPDRKPGSKRQRTDLGVTLQQLVHAGVIRPPLDLERTYKGTALRARVEEDATVSCAGKRYTSLSDAGGHARETVVGRVMSTNGWEFWRFRDKGGDLKPIDVLRQQFLASS